MLENKPKNTNSQTPHSVELRRKTATAAAKKKRENGQITCIALNLKPELANRLKAYKQATGTWEQTIEKLLGAAK